MAKCVSLIRLKDPRGSAGFLDVPCGKCGNCRANRRNDWSFRIGIEAKNSLSTKFLTLTYRDEEIKYHESGCPTLCKHDLQKFIKRIRKAQDGNKKSSIRYYAVGEYGTKTHRPHYHIILFNCFIDNHKLVNLWGMGHVMAGKLSKGGIHYATKYHVNYDKEFSKDIREPEFATMSKNPGIGASYIEDSGKWNYENGFLHVMNNGYKQRLPRYYRDRIFDEDTRTLLGELQLQLSETAEAKEVERLKELGYSDPELELELRTRAAAERVRKKARSQDTL